MFYRFQSAPSILLDDIICLPEFESLVLGESADVNNSSNEYFDSAHSLANKISTDTADTEALVCVFIVT